MKTYEEALQFAIAQREDAHKRGYRCPIHIVKKDDYYATATSEEDLAYALALGYEEVTK